MSAALAPPRPGPFRAVAGAYREAFSGLPRPVWLLSAVTLVNRSGTMVLPFLALYLTEQRGLSPAGAGALLGLYGLGSIGGAYLGGWLSDRLGPRRVMGGSLVLGGAGFLVLGALRSPAAIGAALVYLSVVGEAFRPAVAAAVVRVAPPPVRTRAYALLRLAVNLGMTVGPVAAGFLAQVDYLWLFVGDGGTCLAAAAVLWASFRERSGSAGAPAEAAAPPPHTVDGGSPWRDRPFLAMTFLTTLLSVVFFQLLSTYPLTLHAVYGFPEALVGAVFGVNTLIIVAVEMVLVHRLRALRPLSVAAAGALFVGLGFGILPLGAGGGLLPPGTGYAAAFVLFSLVLWTAGEMLAFPFLQGYAAERAHGRAEGAYMGLFTLVFSIGFAAAPLAGTWVYQRLGPQWVWYGSGLACAVLAAGFELLARRSGGSS